MLALAACLTGSSRRPRGWSSRGLWRSQTRLSVLLGARGGGAASAGGSGSESATPRMDSSQATALPDRGGNGTRDQERGAGGSQLRTPRSAVRQPSSRPGTSESFSLSVSRAYTESAFNRTVSLRGSTLRFAAAFTPSPCCRTPGSVWFCLVLTARC